MTQATSPMRNEAEIKEVLAQCIDYFDGRADADHNGNSFVPNEAMRLLGDCKALLASLDGEAEGADGESDLRAANARRQAEWDKDDKITLSFRGNELAGEVGEACNIIKKLDRERLGIRGSRATKEQLAEELADVVICADLIAMHEGIDLLNDAVPAKFNATSEKVGLKTRLAPRVLASATPDREEELARALRGYPETFDERNLVVSGLETTVEQRAREVAWLQSEPNTPRNATWLAILRDFDKLTTPAPDAAGLVREPTLAERLEMRARDYWSDSIDARLLREAASALSQEWMPIDSAPKDGTPLLIWDDDCNDYTIGRWSDFYKCWIEWDAFQRREPKDSEIVGAKIYLATHYRLLPPPPSGGR